MLNAFYVIYTSSNENLEQHKRLGFLSHMTNESLITHTDVAGDNVLKFGLCLHLHTLCIRAAKVMLCLTAHFHMIAHSFIAQHWVMNRKSNVLAHLIYNLFTILINLVCFETCKG